MPANGAEAIVHEVSPLLSVKSFTALVVEKKLFWWSFFSKISLQVTMARVLFDGSVGSWRGEIETRRGWPGWM